MSVHTLINLEELKIFLRDYPLGTIQEFSGIEDGVTNSIYFLRADNEMYVLTIFEETSAEELPFYLELTHFLNQHHIPCNHAITRRDGSYIGYLHSKPAIITHYLPGKVVVNVNTQHCYSVGSLLAKMHLATEHYPHQQNNPRGKKWREKTAKALYSVLTKEDATFLKEEMNYQSQQNIASLPKAIIHADLFRDNVLFEHDQLTGFIDFYYACYDSMLLDLAITINDWCINKDNSIDKERQEAFLNGYQQIRKITDIEWQHWNSIARLATLRFWLSRLYDFYFVKRGDLVQIKDPKQYQGLLCYYREKE